jgi:hypothetical protein
MALAVEHVGLGGMIGHFPTGSQMVGFHFGGTEKSRLFDVDVVIFRVPEELERLLGPAAVKGGERFERVVG